MKNFFFPILMLAFTLMHAQAPENANDICPILIGETVPDAQLVNPKGQTVSLSALLSSQKTVLVFYRGGWCPYCNRQLAGLAEIENSVLELGFQIIAISPDDHRNLIASSDKNAYRYQLLSDPDAKLIQKIGIGFMTNAKTKDYIIKKSPQGEPSPVMPVPAVMVLDKTGKILFEYINPEYSQRLSGDMLLAILTNLEK